MFATNTLSEQTILITGGGSGLGLAMAHRFAELGASVAICGRNAEKLVQAKIELEKHGGKVKIYAVDVRDYGAVANMVAYFVDELGKITALINNAAGNFICASEDLTPNGFKAVVDIVLHGTFNCTHILGKHWIESHQKGNVLNIITTYTESGSAFVLPSACAKAGVAALTNSLAFEWGPYGIRLNTIAPGPFPTEGAWSRLLPDQRFHQQMIDNNPLKRLGDPTELANLAAFLLSDMSGFINGACIAIDGGERLQGAQFNQYTQRFSREELKELFRTMKSSKS